MPVCWEQVGQFAERALGPEPPASPEQLAADGYLDAGMAAQGPNGSGDYEAALERARVAAAQDALITRLPKVGWAESDTAERGRSGWRNGVRAGPGV